MYALLDWDNSLRSGATLFTWTDYLVEKGILSPGVVDERKELQARYRRGEFSHDDLSRECCVSYLRAMDGMEESRYQALLRDYFPKDRHNLAPHTPVLMAWLRQRGITPVVVSGSPHDVIEGYFAEFGVKHSHDFLTRITDGRVDGSFLCSGGHDKQSVVTLCQEQFGEAPVLAAGDSSSDLPMLEAARFPIVIGTDEAMHRRFPNAPTITCTPEGADAMDAYLRRCGEILDAEGSAAP